MSASPELDQSVFPTMEHEPSYGMKAASRILICGIFPPEAHLVRASTRHAAAPHPGAQLKNLRFFTWLLQSHERRQHSQTTRPVRIKSSFVNTRIVILTSQALDSSGFMQGATWLRQSTGSQMTAVV